MLTTVLPDPQSHKNFYAYPLNCVTDAISCPTQANELLSQLHSAGFEGEQIGILHGENGIQILDRTGKHHGIFAKIWRLMQYLSTKEQTIMRNYEECMKNGGYLFKVKTDGSQQSINQVAKLFEASRAQMITAFHPFSTRIFAL